MRKLTIVIALLALALPAAGAESPWRLGMALGYGERGNPLVSADDIPVVVDLDIAWFGKRWFFDNWDIGFTFHDGRRMTASLIARARSDQVFFGRANFKFLNIARSGETLADQVPLRFPDRHFAGELGVELLTDGRWGLLQINAFHDVTGIHNGYEVSLDYGIGLRRGRWYFEPGLRLAYKSAALNDYYWGIRHDESSPVLPFYQAGAGINAGITLRASYHFSKRWALRTAVDYESLNDDIAASPIVKSDRVLGYFAGIGVRF